MIEEQRKLKIYMLIMIIGLIMCMTLIKSNTYAYSFNDFCEFLQNTYDYQQAGAKTQTNRIIELKSTIQTFIDNNFVER